MSDTPIEDCEFCELDGYGEHAPRCPVTLEHELAAARKELDEARAECERLTPYLKHATNCLGGIGNHRCECGLDDLLAAARRDAQADEEREAYRLALTKIVNDEDCDPVEVAHSALTPYGQWVKASPEETAQINAAVKDAQAGQAAQPVELPPVENQNARFAIDGAIAYGKAGINKPPSDDHWLMEYWIIGQRLAAPAAQPVEDEATRWRHGERIDAPAAQPVDEIEQLRREQALAVMPLIGHLLDAWDRISNDEIEPEHPLAKAIGDIYKAMEGEAAPAAQPDSWRDAALRIGETFASVGPDGYYSMTAAQWLEWVLDQKQMESTQPDELVEAAKAVVKRWHSRDWKDAPTADYIAALESALRKREGK